MTIRIQFTIGVPTRNTTFRNIFKNVSEGRVTRWHSNGELYSDGQFINGNRSGEFNWYYDSGKRKERSFFDAGKRIATTTQWYENGNKHAEGNYKKGQLSGKLTWWYEDGRPSSYHQVSLPESCPFL